ncbi:MAG: hypothetical protein KKH94_04260 [Candidatus Omnitrophica bacterium]|nr:hypothetical protein [Candidatus Omnitrophota bacterium]
MFSELTILMLTAVSIAFLHTLFGPDHYVPFIVMSKARKWSYVKTLSITVICGLGHVGSSIVLGLVGVGLGVTVTKLELFESMRGNWAAWGLIAFGLVYFIYGIRAAFKNKPHTHGHDHSSGEKHLHGHTHYGEHTHVHEAGALSQYVPWTLFVIFILGPCEPLIPLLMYPAAKYNFFAVAMVTGIFSLITIATMVGIVTVSAFGLKSLSIRPFERYAHAAAGFALLLCGCAIQFLGL